VAADLEAEVAKITNEASKGKYSEAVRGALRATLKQRKIERLEKSLADHKKVLENPPANAKSSGSDSSIELANTTDRHSKSKGNDAILKEQLETSTNVDATLRGFIRALSQGRTQMRELLTAESASVKETVASESERTRHELSTKIRELAIDKDNEAACNRACAERKVCHHE